MKPPPISPHTSARLLAEGLAAGIDSSQIVAALREALSATSTTRSGVVEPDHRTRLDASKVILSYALGTPIQRSENVTVNLESESAVGLADRLRSSPALRDSLRRALAEADESGRNSRPTAGSACRNE
jgi:hypothetical protein